LQLDVCDLSVLDDASFDAVVCYGGPLSYVFERRALAVDELRRVVRPGGHLLLSVMSLWGAVHQALPGVLRVDREQNARIIATGDLHFGTDDETRHQCHLYRSGELAALLTSAGLEVELLSASNCLSTAWGELLREVRADDARWEELLGMEVEACREPGCLDMGTHLIAVARRPP
jgi:SAM-dependent methyltransferase